MLGFKHAFRGLFLTLKERNFKVELFVFIIVVFLAFYFQISKYEWLAILLVSALVLATEIINTSIEKIGDYLTLESNSKIKDIKDISAAAVLLSSLFSIIIGLIIFFPYLYSLIKQ